MTGTRADLQKLAEQFGYALVPKQQIANWRHVFVDLINMGRSIYAAKLWDEVTRGDGQSNLKKAQEHIDEIRNHNVALPVGNEYPDLAQARLDYYANAPWKERADRGKAVA